MYERTVMWKALLYVETEIEQETALIKWIDNEQTILCRAVDEPVTEQGIFAAAGLLGVALSECLMIVARDAEWALSQRLDMAALPYASVRWSKQQFTGAWLVVEGFEEVNECFLQRVYERHHGLPWRILTTPRCMIRELALDDLDDLFELYAQDGLAKYVEPLYPKEEEIAYQRAYIDNMYRYYGYGMWLIFRRDSKKLIGRAGLEHRAYPEGTELELGYLIAPEEQNKGYATEVCRSIIDFAKKELDFPRLNCLIQPENAVSIHLARRLGFRFLERTELTGEPMERYVLDLC